MNRQTCRNAVVADSGAVYTRGISERRGTESRFYHGDIKNFVEQTDSSGQIVLSQQYDAFGNPVSSTGAWSGPFAYGGRFGYQSDSDISLSLLGHRYYDSTTGRFLTRDPIGDGRNWYGYCGNNPLAFCDPDGLRKTLIVIFIDTSGPPSLADGDFLSHVLQRFGGLYDVEVLERPSKQQLEDALVRADAVIIYGHGGVSKERGAFLSLGKQNSFYVEDLKRAIERRRASGRGLLDFAWLAVCCTLQDPHWVSAWLQLAKILAGFDTVTFGAGAKGPLIFYRKPERDPRFPLSARVPGGPSRTWYPDPRYVGGQVGGGTLR